MIGDTVGVLFEIHAERTRQDDKWGIQNWPIGGSSAFRAHADRVRQACNQAAQDGTLTWRHILDEEFWEAFAEEDPQSQRAELVQVAAVAVAMIECIDRKESLCHEAASPILSVVRESSLEDSGQGSPAA